MINQDKVTDLVTDRFKSIIQIYIVIFTMSVSLLVYIITVNDSFPDTLLKEFISFQTVLQNSDTDHQDLELNEKEVIGFIKNNQLTIASYIELLRKAESELNREENNFKFNLKNLSENKLFQDKIEQQTQFTPNDKISLPELGIASSTYDYVPITLYILLTLVLILYLNIRLLFFHLKSYSELPNENKELIHFSLGISGKKRERIIFQLTSLFLLIFPLICVIFIFFFSHYDQLLISQPGYLFHDIGISFRIRAILVLIAILILLTIILLTYIKTMKCVKIIFS